MPELDHQRDHPGAVFFLAVDHSWRSSKIIGAEWRTFTPYKGNNRITQCDIIYTVVRHPRGGYIVLSLLVSGSGHTGN